MHPTSFSVTVSFCRGIPVTAMPLTADYSTSVEGACAQYACTLMFNHHNIPQHSCHMCCILSTQAVTVAALEVLIVLPLYVVLLMCRLPAPSVWLEIPATSLIRSKRLDRFVGSLSSLCMSLEYDFFGFV